ncbi:hypothetical protein MNBD_GAMMA26-542 [hydrothermal vent metagenome]|uniref:Iron-binding zinc finger CDGSH type domain-containing protein n=1 Tax=hydrothermal vent metagenome TaxID=652676 RepID=A0A3B1B8M9_9ZZZZ
MPGLTAVRNAPYDVELESGEHWWCSCGFSKKQPFCDGSHEEEDTDLKPLKVELSKRQNVALCGCRQSKKKPFCDGTHESSEG